MLWFRNASKSSEYSDPRNLDAFFHIVTLEAKKEPITDIKTVIPDAIQKNEKAVKDSYEELVSLKELGVWEILRLSVLLVAILPNGIEIGKERLQQGTVGNTGFRTTEWTRFVLCSVVSIRLEVGSDSNCSTLSRLPNIKLLDSMICYVDFRSE